MTRINVRPVAGINTKQLHGEYVELPRAFVVVRDRVTSGKGVDPREIPDRYTLNKGHVLFFANKLLYLLHRYEAICVELVKRGFKLNPRLLQAEFSMIPEQYWNDWEPDERDHLINEARIQEALRSMKERGIA